MPNRMRILTAPDADRAELERRATDRGAPARVAERARIEGGELLSRPVDQDRLGCFGLGLLTRPFDELAVDEGRSGADQGDEVWGVHGTPAVLR